VSKPSFDPGFTQQVGGVLRRAINKDGSFNVRRRRTHWRDVHPYLYVISISWMAFLGLVFASYLLVNTLFAGVYYIIGPEALQGQHPESETGRSAMAASHLELPQPMPSLHLKQWWG
jgi:inward rectifier potassium channel